MEQDSKPIYTWDAQPSRRNLTAADIRACKGMRKLTQTTANTVEEAADEVLAAFRDASLDGSFPGPAENARIPQEELDTFLSALETQDQPGRNPNTP